MQTRTHLTDTNYDHDEALSGPVVVGHTYYETSDVTVLLVAEGSDDLEQLEDEDAREDWLTELAEETAQEYSTYQDATSTVEIKSFRRRGNVLRAKVEVTRTVEEDRDYRAISRERASYYF